MLASLAVTLAGKRRGSWPSKSRADPAWIQPTRTAWIRPDTYADSKPWRRIADIHAALPPGSPQLQYYLCRTYGTSVLSETWPGRDWNWWSKAIIWIEHLPPHLRAAARGVRSFSALHDHANWPDKYQGTLFQALPGWPNPGAAVHVYQFNTVCASCKQNEGGRRGAPVIDPAGGWLEVTHRHSIA